MRNGGNCTKLDLRFITGVSRGADINGINGVWGVCGVNGNGVGVQSIRFTPINGICGSQWEKS